MEFYFHKVLVFQHLDPQHKSYRKCFISANKTSEAFVFDLAILKSYYKAQQPLPEAEKRL